MPLPAMNTESVSGRRGQNRMRVTEPLTWVLMLLFLASAYYASRKRLYTPDGQETPK